MRSSSRRPATATFPYPAPPGGPPPQDYAAYCFLPTTSLPMRPSDFTGGTAWKLTCDQSGDPSIDASPAELFGVRCGSEAWSGVARLATAQDAREDVRERPHARPVRGVTEH